MLHTQVGSCVDNTNASESRRRVHYMIAIALVCCGGGILVAGLLVHVYTSSTLMDQTWYLALLAALGYMPLAFGAVLWRYVGLEVPCDPK